MSEIAEFKVFCLERCKNEHHMKCRDAFRLFKEYGVLNYLDSFTMSYIRSGINTLCRT
jgi:hypothetical protein